MKIAIYYMRKFALYTLYNINFIELNNLFEEVEYDQFKFLKVINKKYKKELFDRYED